MLSTLTGSVVFAAPTMPARMAQIETSSATMINDSTVTLRAPDRALVRTRRQLPDSDGDCADAGISDTEVVTVKLAPQAISGNLRAARTIR